MKIETEGDIPKHLMEEMQKDKPSDEASFWAKSSCKHCYGRGTIETTVIDKDKNSFISDRLCVCAHRAFKKWQKGWVEARKPKKIVPSNGKKGKTEQERYDLIQPRVEKLQDGEVALLSEIGGIENRIDSLPQHAVITGFEQQVEVEKKTREGAQGALSEAGADLERLNLSASWLEKQLKEKRKEIARHERDVLPVLTRLVDGVDSRISSLKEEKSRVEKELSRVSHGMRKRHREAGKKLERVQARLSRILKENQLESRISTNSTQLPNITGETPEERIDNCGGVG